MQPTEPSRTPLEQFTEQLEADKTTFSQDLSMIGKHLGRSVLSGVTGLLISAKTQFMPVIRR